MGLIQCPKEGGRGALENKAAFCIEAVIGYIESHLDGKLDLDTVAAAAGYSKYHLHRMFTETTGLTMHEYIQRRQLTEAAKLLCFSDKPIVDVALSCGYESQQAFTSAFTAMYKTPPAAYRDRRAFYPLQLRFMLSDRPCSAALTKRDIRPALAEDLEPWMQLMRLSIDGYPALDEADYAREIEGYIRDGRALTLWDGELLVGVLAHSVRPCSIDFMGVHPQYRRRGIQKLFLEALAEDVFPGQEIAITTYREGDRADTGYREELKALGFAERELLVEFGYPTQRFVFAPSKAVRKDISNEK